MTGTRKPQGEHTFEDLDRQLILKAALDIDEIFKFKDSVGTPQRNAIMKRIKELYVSASTASANETVSQVDTYALAKMIIYRIRKEAVEMNRTRGVWYTDHRMDWFGIMDEKVKENIESVAAVMYSKDLIKETRGISSIRVKNYGKVFDLWDGENFRDQPIAAGKMCTGFLVEKDIIATAAHFATEENVKDLCFVFGYRMVSPAEPVIRIPGKDIYRGIEMVDHVLNLDEETDFALVRLDRAVEDRDVLTLSKDDGSGDVGIYVLGHPCGLPLKYAPGAKVQKFKKNCFTADLDVYMGNSGSPVFNSKNHEVIGMLANGNTRDFRWTGKGWATVVYPNREIKATVPQCTKAARFYHKVRQQSAIPVRN